MTMQRCRYCRLAWILNPLTLLAVTMKDVFTNIRYHALPHLGEMLALTGKQSIHWTLSPC